jgi:hypothetical protein
VLHDCRVFIRDKLREMKRERTSVCVPNTYSFWASLVVLSGSFSQSSSACWQEEETVEAEEDDRRRINRNEFARKLVQVSRQRIV